MKYFLKKVASCLLFINGTGAIYGGYKLFSAPDGSGFGMPLDMLQHSPFHDFFIPGIILFTVNGLFSLFVLALLLFKYKNYAWCIIAQGAILCGWIAAQVFFLQAVAALHVIFMSIGILLVVCGGLLAKRPRKMSSNYFINVQDQF